MMLLEDLIVHTPLVSFPSTSSSLLHTYPHKVHLKLENLQNSSSFKMRGIGNMCLKLSQEGCTHLVCSSGGNAGIAAASAAKKLCIPVTIYLPTSTPSYVSDRLKLQGANVTVIGNQWSEANEAALSHSKEPGIGYVHPFEHQYIWDGNATMVKEMQDDLKGQGEVGQPDLVVVAVGGGGMLNGVVQGIKEAGWHNTKVLGMETVGADCLNQSIKAGHSVSLSEIKSIAKTLGAKSPSPTALDHALAGRVLSCTVSDATAVDACLRFADEYRMLIEPSCGCAVSALYDQSIISSLQTSGLLPDRQLHVVVVVCGGNIVTLQQLHDWKLAFKL